VTAFRVALSALFLLAIRVAAFAQPTLAPIQIIIPGGGGGGGGGCSLSLTASTANLVLSPNPLTCTGGATVGTTQPFSVQSNPTNYAITPSTDASALVQITSSSDTTPTLSDSTVSGFGQGFGFGIVSNSGPITLTLPGVSTLGGLSSLALANNQSADIVSDGSNYQLLLGMPVSCSQNQVIASPNGASGQPVCRALVVGDMPTITVPLGGTGLTSLTAHGVLIGEGTANVSPIVGTAGQALISGGASADPTYMTRIDSAILSVPSNITLANGTTPLIGAFKQTSGTITSVDSAAVAGSFTWAIQIGGVNVTGCNGISTSSSTNVTTTCSAANTLASGNRVTVVISSASGSPDQAYVQVNYSYVQ